MLDPLLELLDGVVRRGPYPLFLRWPLLFAAVWLVLRVPAAQALLRRVARPSVAWTWALATGALVVGTSIAYTASDTLIDHVEPQIAAVSAMAARGGSVYHALDAGERYNLLYGPGSYLIPALFVRVLGPAVWVVKLPTTLALAAGLVLLGRAYVRLAGAAFGAALLAVAAGTLLAFGRTLFWARPEALLFLAVALGLDAAARLDGRRAWIATGVAVGLATVVKVHGAVYLLPALALLGRRCGARSVVLAALAGGGLSLLPFLLPQVSAATYSSWIVTAASHGLVPRLLGVNALLALAMSLPCLALLAEPRSWRAPWRDRLPYLAALAATLVLAALAGSKLGAGHWYMLPAVPAAYAAVPIVRRTPDGVPAGSVPASAWLVQVLLVLVGAASGWREHAAASAKSERFAAAGDELTRLVAESQREGSVGFAPTGSGVLQDFRMIPVLMGEPLWFDTASMMDLRLAGLELPEETYRILEECCVHTWISRIGGEPFTLPSFYPPHRELFGEELRALFHERYERVDGGGRLYELWRPRRRGR